MYKKKEDLVGKKAKEIALLNLKKGIHSRHIHSWRTLYSGPTRSKTSVPFTCRSYRFVGGANYAKGPRPGSSEKSGESPVKGVVRKAPTIPSEGEV